MVVGFICEKTGERLPFEACLECARTRLNRKLDCPFDEATIAGMILNERRSTEISVTMITGCHRVVFINQFYETYVAPSQLYWAFRGQIAHKILEEANLHPDAVKEKKFTKAWDGIDITGHPDLIIPSQKVLKDYKTTKTVPSYLNKDGIITAYENHRTQVNLYRWLVPYDIAEMEVVYFSMDETLICPVEIWLDESTRKADMTVRKVLEENLVPLKMALDSETMPPYQRNWSCDGYCSVADICFMELKKEILAARWAERKKAGGKKNANRRSSQKDRRVKHSA
jgi:CRISPR/Cas system-associated exonuclease Cas4 (RecB family)